MDVVTATQRRFEEAVPVWRGGEWWVEYAGEVEEVLPAGVLRDDDWDHSPARLSATLHDCLEDLRLVATVPTAEGAAVHLAAHVRQYSAPDLCVHGLPMYHRREDQEPGSCAVGGPPGSIHEGARLTDVIELITLIDGLYDAADRLQSQRRGLTGRVANDILASRLVPAGFAVRRRAELQRDGSLTLSLSRRLVRIALDEAMAASQLHLATRWPPQQRPQLALVAETTVGGYIADALAHIGINAVDRTFVCSVCGQPFTPKRSLRDSEGRYCHRPECQRRRTALKQARHRARKKEASDG